MRPELEAKVAKSVERLKAFEPPEGYYLAFSGGKDSVVCKALCDMAKVKYDAHYRVTSVDPPELVRFIKEKHPGVARDVPRDRDGKPITMWNLIPKKKMPPTRLSRYCCEQLKEGGGDGRLTVTGVRWAESIRRKDKQGVVTFVKGRGLKKLGEDENFKETKGGGVILVNDNTESRRMIEQCYTRHKTTLNPIIDWTDEDVWEFIHENHIPYCSLYDEGFKRLGCIGCPMAVQKAREAEFKRWSKYEAAYRRAFEQMLEERKKAGRNDSSHGHWQSVTDLWRWWMGYDVTAGQIDIFEEAEDEP